MPRDKFFLKHIRDAIDQIYRYTNDISEETFMAEEIIQDAVIRQLEIIGEAAKNLSEVIRLKEAKIPWKKMARMRDYLAHHYFRIDIDIVWTTIQEDLPSLKKQIYDLLDDA